MEDRDRNYLYELAHILDNSITDQHSYGTDEVRFIKIESIKAKEIAERLRRIASKMPNTVH